MNNEQRTRMQTRANAIAILRRANLEDVPTYALVQAAFNLRAVGAVPFTPAPPAPMMVGIPRVIRGRQSSMLFIDDPHNPAVPSICTCSPGWRDSRPCPVHPS